jgi:hypothetical protein
MSGQWSIGLVCCLLLSGWLLACQRTTERQAASPAGPVPRASLVAEQRDSDPAAVRLADRVMQALGGRAAWDRTRHVSWNFFGMRRHYWDKWTGNVRIEHEDVVVLLNLDSRAGRVQQAAVEITDEEALRQHLERAYAWWINDSYWMFMPYKLRDPGVRLTLGDTVELPDGRAADMLVVTFAAVGLTPRNRYDVAIARDTGLVEQWSFYTDRDDASPRFVLPWSGWQRFGEIMLATSHGRDTDWQIAVIDDLPASVYTSFAPVPPP